jgi:hypothetical protein
MLKRNISSVTALLLFAVLAIILTAIPATAQDSLLVSYQGYLTDDQGNPVNGTESMIFTIYDTDDVSKWTEAQPSVQVNEGYFTVVLGSETALPDSVFDGDDRYLGITVNGDSEISPRTLFTSTPVAAVARKVAGDVTTGEGEMILRSSTGADSAIVLSADAFAHLLKINWQIPPDDIRPGLEMGSDANSSFMRVNWSLPPDDQYPAFEVLSDGASQAVNMKLGMPPDDQKPEFEVSLSAVNNTAQMGMPPNDIMPGFMVNSDGVAQTISARLAMPPDDQLPEFEVNIGANNSLIKLGVPPGDIMPKFDVTLSGVDGTAQMGMPPDDIMPGFMVESDGMAQTISARLSMPPDDQLPEFEVNVGANSSLIKLGIPPNDIMPEFAVTLSGVEGTAQMGLPPDDIMPGFMVESDGMAQTISARLSMPPDDIKPEIELFADGNENSIKVGFALPPDDIEPAIKLSSTDTENKIKVNWAMPPDDIRPGLELGSNANSNFMRVNWSLPPDDIMPAFEVVSDGISESIEMKLGLPPDDQMPEIGFSVDQTVTAFSMNSPTGDLNPDFQIQTSSSSGTGMFFFDDVRKKMGIEPSPFNEGFGLKFYDPTQVSETELIALGGYYGDSTMARFQMFHPLATTPSAPQIDLITTETANFIKLGNISTDAGTSGIIMNASDNFASIALGSGPGAPGSIITIDTDATEARVGIGTESPSEPLVVGADITWFDGTMITVSDQNPTQYAGIAFGENNGNRGWMAYYNENDYIAIGTRENGVFSPNQIFIKGGDLGIGTNSPGADLHVVGDICYTGSSGSCSDRRYKKNISTLTHALDKVSQIRGVGFNWRKDEFPENEFSDEKQVGFVAQELAEVFPEVVSEDNNGYYNVDYGKLTPLLVEAIKEQQKQIEALNKRIDELESIKMADR